MTTIERWTIHGATGLTALACVAWLAESAAGTQSVQDGMRQLRQHYARHSHSAAYGVDGR